MASTRNLNTKYDYLCEKKQNKGVIDYMTEINYGKNNNTAFFLDGPNPKMYGDNLSNNMIDVESKLRGIRATNMEGANFNPSMSKKSVPCKKLYEKTPLYVPESFSHNPHERPMYLN